MKKLEQPLISIIVPVYKVEKYLKRCVDGTLRDLMGIGIKMINKRRK